jgi:hypothetical protein
LGDLEDWGLLEVFRGRPVASLGTTVGVMALSTAVAVVAGMKLSGQGKVK